MQLHNVDDDETSSGSTGHHSTVHGNLRVCSKVEAPSQSAFDNIDDPLRYDEKCVITWDISRRHIHINDSFMDHLTSDDAILPKLST